MKNLSAFFSTLMLLLALSLTSLRAEVVDSSRHGFTVMNKALIQASPEEVYEHFTHHIGQWWSDAHSWSGKAANISIDPRPNGCWCEQLPVNGQAVHMQTVFTKPGEMIRFQGALGPLQSMAVQGSMTLQFTKVAEGTQVEWLYTVSGYHPKGMQIMAGPVDGVLAQQLGRLKEFVEKDE
jgi:uncharacterized protein YndB with AHSA1/START domain